MGSGYQTQVLLLVQQRGTDGAVSTGLSGSDFASTPLLSFFQTVNLHGMILLVSLSLSVHVKAIFSFTSSFLLLPGLYSYLSEHGTFLCLGYLFLLLL